MSTATLVQPADVLPTVPSGIWQIDPAHSGVGFTIRHLMSRVRGRFTEFAGQVAIEEDRLDSSVRVEVALASVDTGNGLRDNHLRTQDFFDVEADPTMTFTSTALRAAGDSWHLEGELTLRGTTRTVQIELDYLGYDPSGLQGESRIGFEGRTSIRRSDYGVSFGLVDGGKIVIADRVDILLEIEAVYTGPADAAEESR